ncbi:MAG TPA: ankyrin repeat domain-containing protein [Chloroflexota bacterium]|nr:ankyrin repeat domain-containing protein [Chloroflexota bacterium]
MATQSVNEPGLVQAFVGNAHGDLAKVQELLAARPGLLNAAWDWGNGDWETALGAAAHTGQKAIALFLLDRGARLDLFAAAMLGMTDVVRSALEAYPGLAATKGPHGIPLIEHAKAGGAEEVVRLLEGAT